MDAYIKPIIVVIILVLFLAFWIFNFIIIYHLTRFGVGTLPKKLSVLFLLGSVALFFSSVVFFANIDTAGLKSQLERLGGNFANLKTIK